VQLGLAADDLARGQPEPAIEHYSRVLYLAQRTGDRARELEALTGIVTALTDLRRYTDAVSHCERALDLARDVGDAHWVQDLGRRGLDLLVRLGDESDSARRQAFEQALLTGL
jgi:tetratricopeptide (TPR) repeat protein